MKKLPELAKFLKKFSNLFHLLQNEPIRLEAQKFACPFCPKIMRSGALIRRHIFVHTGEEPYACIYCNRTFSQKGTCKRHISTCQIRKS